MTTDLTKNALLISSITLLIALLPLPYGYYTFLRILVTLTALLAAYKYWGEDETSGRVFFFIAIALFFNPLVPVFLDKSIWVWIDVPTAISFLWFRREMAKKEGIPNSDLQD